ncbi:hypothetical protein F5X68DRAFT_16791 [Plectosphaerella plurivora]|uniref:Galactose oxidase/kelch, beta-propeller n=1 Tax=Plectosphaerella plurivora TaxID=936078 RepID=A0A9P8V9H8_9PEZI|nr:hypothetical protein F5X68DRAFT_16791 [Plectosphaerella plurivora]
MSRYALPCFLSLASAGLVSRQFEGWTPDQVNASICLWEQPRAAVIRDTVYLDGGLVYWARGLSNGEYDVLQELDNPEGFMYTLNFSQPFNVSGNITSLLTLIDKAPQGDANNFAPNYVDGAMLANDAQLTLYGGLLRMTENYPPPHQDDVLTYRKFSYGTDRESFQSSFVQERLPDGLTRYVSSGGAVNAPSELKSWYFGGLRAAGWGEIARTRSNTTYNAANISDTFITLDTTTQRRPVWTNTTLPPDVKSRANPEVVWVPVGEQGILVVIGGVTYPEWTNSKRKSENPAQSKEESDEFMRVIDIYDVASGEWYKQPTENAPTARTRACAVLAPSNDFSSFNIYYYGGYAGVDPKVEMNDEVWVLSIPSFTWTKISEGRPDYGRNGHKCLMPYPDQMMVIGGVTSQGGRGLACHLGGLIQVFNLTSGEWMDGYDPEEYADYGVPDVVRSVIGGDSTGGATLTTPTPSGWATSALGDIFQTSYATTKIQTYYPYTKAEQTGRPPVDDPNGGDDNTGGGGGGLPRWVAPVLGVVLGLVFLTALLVAFCLWRRRKILRGDGYTETTTDDNGTRILSWIRGQPAEHKALTVTTTEDTPSNAEMAEVRSPASPASPVVAPRFEMMDTAIAELPDTSRPPELPETALTPTEIINKHSNLGNPPTNQTSYYGSVSGNEASSFSRSSGVLGPGSRADSPTRGPPSPSLASPASPSRRVFSGVSGISERDTAHLRQISEVTVSSASDGGGNDSAAHGVSDQSSSSRAIPPRSVPLPCSPPSDLMSPVTPSPLSPAQISPPTAPTVAEDSDDYISSRRVPAAPGSPRRASVFRESADDMGHK